jgi:hypothetical protein
MESKAAMFMFLSLCTGTVLSLLGQQFTTLGVHPSANVHPSAFPPSRVVPAAGQSSAVHRRAKGTFEVASNKPPHRVPLAGHVSPRELGFA